jgi:tetratricopeptide (TPR) repeat protein
MIRSQPRRKNLLRETRSVAGKTAAPVPPMLEEALGYAGAARFVAFYESYLRRVGPRGSVIVDDGHVLMPGNSDAWKVLLQHPVFALLADRVHLNLRSQPYIDEKRLSDALSKEEQNEFFRNSRAIVLDRVDRVLYGGRVDNARVFIMIASSDTPCSSDEEDTKPLDTDCTSDRVDPVLEHDGALGLATPDQIASLRRWPDTSLCKTADARWLLGRVYLDQQEFTSAVECFEAAVGLDREVLRQDGALGEMAEAYFFCDRFGDAARLLEQQIRDVPDDLNVYGKLMHVYARDNRVVEAREVADRAARVLPNEPLAPACCGSRFHPARVRRDDMVGRQGDCCRPASLCFRVEPSRPFICSGVVALEAQSVQGCITPCQQDRGD